VLSCWFHGFLEPSHHEAIEIQTGPVATSKEMKFGFYPWGFSGVTLIGAMANPPGNWIFGSLEDHLGVSILVNCLMEFCQSF